MTAYPRLLSTPGAPVPPSGDDCSWGALGAWAGSGAAWRDGKRGPGVTSAAAFSCLFPWWTRSMTASTARTVSKSSAKAACTAALVRPSLGEESAGLSSVLPPQLQRQVPCGPLAHTSRTPTRPSLAPGSPAPRAQGRPGRAPSNPAGDAELCCACSCAQSCITQRSRPSVDRHTDSPLACEQATAHPCPRPGGPWPTAPDLAGLALSSVLHSAVGASRPLRLSPPNASSRAAPEESRLTTLQGPQGATPSPQTQRPQPLVPRRPPPLSPPSPPQLLTVPDVSRRPPSYPTPVS